MLNPNTWPSDIALLIPAYNAAKSLRGLLHNLVSIMPASQILIVDDGSNDQTAAMCREQCLACIRFDKNRGKGSALVAGFENLLYRDFAAIITLDADGQHALSDLAAFINCFRAHPDAGICIGKRDFKPGRMPIARILSNTLTSRILTWMCGVPILDSQCGFRLYSASLLRVISITCPRFEMESEVILKAVQAGFPVHFVPVQTLYFKTRSHIAHITDTLRWIKATLGIWRFMKATRSRS